MKLPRNNDELTEILKNARVPDIVEFKGEYFVDMLTVLPSLKKLSHRKVFSNENNLVQGYNILLNNRIWGHFFLEHGTCEDVDSADAIVINYARKENSFFSYRMIDYVRCVEDETLYLGRFNYMLFGKPRFLGYFTLSKTA
jgi:hypothetical protein